MTTVSVSVDARDGNWVKIGVYKLLQEWLNKPSDNLGLVVIANDSEGRQVAVTNPEENPSYVSKMVATDNRLKGWLGNVSRNNSAYYSTFLMRDTAK